MKLLKKRHLVISLKIEIKHYIYGPLLWMKFDNINNSYCENRLLCINLNATILVNFFLIEILNQIFKD